MKTKGILYSILILVISGCRVTSFTEIGILRIPEKILPMDVERAAVFSISENQDSTEGFYIKINGRLYPDTISTDSVSSFALYGIADALKLEHSLDTVLVFEDYSPSFVGVSSPRISRYDLNQLKDTYNLDYAIVIEEYELETQLEVYSIYNSNKSDLYMDVNPSYVYGLYDFIGEDEDLQKYSDKYTYSESSLLENEMIAFYNNREKMVNDIVYLTSYDFAKKLRPYWEEEERMYFVSGRYLMLSGVEEYRKGNFDSAVSFYEKAFEQGGNSNKYKVAINMALAYEVKDDLPNAINWAEKAYELAKREEDLFYSQEYLGRLQKRWNDIQRFEREILQ